MRVLETALMRNVTSLRGIDVTAFSHGSSGKKQIVASWDWDDVWGGIVQCPHCGRDDPELWSNGHSQLPKTRDRPVGGCPVEIELWCHRYKCAQCRKAFGGPHPDIQDNSSLTISLVNYLAIRARSPDAHTRIARQAGVAESTVRKCFKQHLTPPAELPDHPKAIGVDGVHLGSGGPHVIVTAIGEGEMQVLDVLPDQRKSTLKQYMNDLEPGQKPLPVVIDMSRSFKAALVECWQPVAIVIDRYHLARRGNLVLGSCRNQLISSDLEQEWEARKQKIYNQSQATVPEQIRLKGTGTETLDHMSEVYKAVLWYQWILTAEISRENASRKFDEWRAAVDSSVREQFEKRIFGTLDRWREYVLNYYDYRYTNAFNEGMNNLAKTIDRIGANYDRETLEAKLRYSQNDWRPSRLIYQFYANSRQEPYAHISRAVELPGLMGNQTLPPLDDL